MSLSPLLYLLPHVDVFQDIATCPQDGCLDGTQRVPVIGQHWKQGLEVLHTVELLTHTSRKAGSKDN